MDRRREVRRKGRLGFTLAELLMVVAILIVLFALAIPGLFELQKELRQKELDTKAETIYTAVQNKLSELYSNGNTDAYNPVLHSDVIKELSDAPGDFDSSISGEILDNNNHIYYFVSGNDFTTNLVDDVIDNNLKKGHFVVEMIPYAYRENSTDQIQITAASVYAVYYSEDYTPKDGESMINVTVDYKEDDNYLNIYRTKANRKDKTNARVGYYGGSSGSGSGTSSLSIISVQMKSDSEKNIATIKARKPVGVTGDITFTFTLEDTYGNKRFIKYEEKGDRYVTEDNQVITNIPITKTRVGSNYTFTLTLDDLSKSENRFTNIYGSNSKLFGSDNTNALVEGADIKISAKAESSNQTVAAADEKSAYGNSIYDYQYKDTESTGFDNQQKLIKTDKDTELTAYISTGRHLQNLDSASSKSSSHVINAILENNIELGENSEFYKAYSSEYFNGSTTSFKIASNGNVDRNVKYPNFKGITNEYLSSLTSQIDEESNKQNQFIISDLVSQSITTSTGTGTTGTTTTVHAGLFSENKNNEGLTISYISMTGTRLNGDTYVGGFVSENNNKLTLDHCYQYLDVGTDIPTAITSENNLDSIRWIQSGNGSGGSNSGGLVGINISTLSITDSFASTVIGNTSSTTGGLLGTNNKGTVTINTSYADSYLYGRKVGGLIGWDEGSSTITISDSYTAGFVGLDTEGNQPEAAGLVNGTITKASNLYTIIAYYNVADDNGIDRDSSSSLKGTFNTTAKAITNGASSVYYANTPNDSNNVNNTNSSVDNMNLSNQFTRNKAVTSYKLMGQSLTAYAYPTLTSIPHYGDWLVGFQAGSLVYYEKYNDGSYGFDGAGVDISITSKGDIIGDGYGIIYESQLKGTDEVKYTLGTTEYTLDTSNPHVCSINNKTYYIYPLDPANENEAQKASLKDNKFYTYLEIKGTDSSSRYYYFNYHFAKCYLEVSKDAAMPSPTTISIRSPRHLNDLSSFYDSYYSNESIVSSSVPYSQERNMDYATYDWNDFTEYKDNVTQQGPIGSTEATSFKSTFNGHSNTIENVSFITKNGQYLGLFGHSSGKISNVIVTTQYNQTNSQTVKRNDPIRGTNFYSGILVGYNSGSIDNCAVAGYYLTGSDGTIHGYQNSNIYIGGLVGYNHEDGTITNSSADSPKLALNMYNATCYAGGFVGYNEGTINNTYGLNHITSIVSGGMTNISGFAGFNTGEIRNSYCATALTSSGTTSYTYLFSPNTAGLVTNSYYLYKGSYQFVDGLYSYNGNVSNTSGFYKTYEELKKLGEGSYASASNSFDHALTADNTVAYPYRAIVKNANNELVHYGEWQVDPKLGTYGVFYWEHEELGTNNGYKLTYVGKDELGEVTIESTLCNEHNDKGVITEYGYGFYKKKGETIQVTEREGLSFLSGDNAQVNSNAKTSLEEQIPGLEFYPYTTSIDSNDSSAINLGDNTDINSKITLECKDETTSFYISPLFGNALSMVVDNSTYNSYDGEFKKFLTTNSTYGRSALSSSGSNAIPGSATNSYEIRSADQLQYINWNSNTKNTSDLVNTTNYQTFNYLLYANSPGTTGQQTLSNAGFNANANLHFEQTHDLNASSYSNFTPIAATTTSSSFNAYNASLYAWFGGHFDGESYKIQELNINSSSFTVGLFGVTVDADLQNIILYSENKATIQRSTEYTYQVTSATGTTQTKTSVGDDGAYALGGLVGIAYDYNNNNNSHTISNCAIAGYIIQDNSRNVITLGEVNIGGLIGVGNVNIDRCSAVVDIDIACEHYYYKNDIEGTKYYTTARWGNFIRVGGIAGAIQNKISNSYSGGSIKVSNNLLNETYSFSNLSNNGSSKTNYTYNSGNGWLSTSSTSKANVNTSTNIYIAGIAGSGFSMNYQNFTGNASIRDGQPNVENSYTYMQFPTFEGTIRSITAITSLADRYSQNGNNVTINNCYYYANSALFSNYLPSYYFNGNSNNSIKNIYNNFKDDMLNGSVKFLYKCFDNNSNGSSKITATPTSVTYDTLSSDAMSSKLGSNWAKVSTTDKNGVTVDGYYSFPAGDDSLKDKNYPFPTVIRQQDIQDSNITYNMHYGTWPLDTAYFEEGSSTVDIFNEMSDDGWTYKTLKLVKNDKDINDGSLKFELQVNGYATDIAEIVKQDNKDYTIDENGDYLITIKAKNIGTVDVIATYRINDVSEDPVTVSSSLNITANLSMIAEPNTVTLKENQTSKETDGTAPLLHVYSSDQNKDYAYDDKVTWTATSSKIGSSDEDAVDNPNVSKHKNTQKTLLNMTGTGFNGTVNLKATYNYNGVNISVTNFVTVNAPSTLGLAANTKGTIYKYQEHLVETETQTDSINGEDKEFNIKGSAPTSTDKYYLYELNDTNILENALNTFSTATTTETAITVTAKNGEEELPITVSYDTSVSNADDNGYKTLGMNIDYKNSDTTPLTGVTLLVQVKDTELNNTYVFTIHDVTITPTPYTITLDANGGSFEDGETTKVIERTSDFNISSITEKPSNKTGYDFNNNWYLDANQTIPATNDNLGNDDITLYAGWNAKTVQVDVYEPNSTTSLGRVTLTYDSTTITGIDALSYSATSYRFDGLYKDSAFTTKLTENQQVINQCITDNVTSIYAKLTKYYTFNFVAVDANGTTIKTFQTKSNITEDQSSTESIYTPNATEITSGYTLQGWYTNYDGSGAKLLDAEGKIVDPTTFTSTLENNKETGSITLYALWKHNESTTVYKLDNLEQGSSNRRIDLDTNSKYVIASGTDTNAYVLTAEVSDNNGLVGKNLIKSIGGTGTSTFNYIEKSTLTENAIWSTNNNQKFIIGDKYLQYANNHLTLGNSSNNKSWYYYYYSWWNTYSYVRSADAVDRQYRYIQFNEDDQTFDCTTVSNSNYPEIYVFKCTETSINADVDTFTYSLTATQADESDISIQSDITTESNDESTNDVALPTISQTEEKEETTD